MEEQILNYINGKENVDIEDIQKDLFPSISIKNIKNLLSQMCNVGIIFFNEEEKLYYKIGGTYKKVEILTSSKGNRYFIDENNKKYNIEQNNLNGALNFSKVIIKKENNEYKVVKVLEHKHDKIVCEVTNKFDKKELIPLNLPNNYLIHVNKKLLKILADGDRVLLKAGTNFENNYLDCEFVKVICHRNEPNKELLSIAYSKDFEPDFSEEAIEELKYIPDSVLKDEVLDRLDLRNEMIFTIDGVNTKDMDDAISLKLLDNGNYELGVHIADVTHYVKPKTNLFKEAANRGTSLYMVDSVIPMLPQKLSNEICSLNPNVDRLTKSCIMEIDKKGNVVNSKILDSVIRLKKKMDYDSVNHILEDGIIPEGYEQFYDTLILMQKLSNILTKNRMGQGKIDFVSNEIKINVDEYGKPLQFSLSTQKEAEKLIENFMIMANETVASYFPQLPFVYRVHGIPNELKLDEAVKFITDLGYRVNTCGNAGSPKLIQNILNSLSNKEEYALLSNLLLCAMKKAEYSINNIGHFGLALDNYTHFTSPIRRFPDLMVHTLINKYTKDISKVNFKELEKYLIDACAHSSYKERQADAAEKESEQLMMAKYMEEHIGEEFEGIVISCDGLSMRVRTNDYIYGRVDLTDNNPQTKKFKIGTKILLNVESVSMIDKTVHFSIKEILEENKTKKLCLK